MQRISFSFEFDILLQDKESRNQIEVEYGRIINSFQDNLNDLVDNVGETFVGILESLKPCARKGAAAAMLQARHTCDNWHAPVRFS